MATQSTGRTVLFLIVGLIGISSVSGLAYALITDGDYAQQLAAEQATEDQRVADWCANVRAYVGPNRTFASFEAVAEAAMAGDLATPSTPPPTSSAGALDRWQAEHEAFVTSSYLAELEGYPKAFGFEDAALKSVLSDAHAGRKPGLGSHVARRSGRLLDDYVDDHC